MNYSIVLTSCGRFDLLAVTLASLERHLDLQPAQVVVVEDSGDERVEDTLGRFDMPFRLLINRKHLGQIRSIDRGYSAVEEPYILHCEDDWEFLRAGFVQESISVLDHDASVSMVGLRSKTEMNPSLRAMPEETLPGARIFRHHPSLHPENGGYSFNPGMRRLSDYRAMAPFSAIGHEPMISLAFKRRGQHIATLAEPAVRHVGWDRHVDDPTQPRRPRNLSQRLRRSVSKRWQRLWRRLDG